MNKIIANPNFIFLYAFLTSAAGWFISGHQQKLSKKYDFKTIILFQMIFYLLSIVSFFLFYDNFNFTQFKNDLSKIEMFELLFLLIIGVYSFSIGIISLRMLKYHNVADMKIISFFISILVSGFGVYFFMKNKITLEKIIGFILISIGGYLFSK